MTDRERFDSFLQGVYRPRSDDKIDFGVKTITPTFSAKGIKLYIYKKSWGDGFEAQDPKYSYEFEASVATSDNPTPSGIRGYKKYVMVPSEEYYKENKASVLYSQGFISSPSDSVENILSAYGAFGDAIATKESIKKGTVTRKSKWQLAYDNIGSCYWLPTEEAPNCSDENKIYKNSPVDSVEGIPDTAEEVELPEQMAPADNGKQITVYIYRENSGRWTQGNQVQIFEAHKDLFKLNPPAFLGSYWVQFYSTHTGYAFSQLEYPIPIEGSQYNEMREMTLYERYKAGLYQLQADDEVDDANKTIRKRKPGEKPKPDEGGGTSPKPDKDKPKPDEGGSGQGKKPGANLPKIRPNIPSFSGVGGFYYPPGIRHYPVNPAPVKPLPPRPAPVKPEPARPKPVEPAPPKPEPKILTPLPPAPAAGHLHIQTDGAILLKTGEGGTMTSGGVKAIFIYPIKDYKILEQMEGEF